MAGFVGAFLYATQGAVIEFASGRCATDHVDTMFTFLIGASVLLVMRSLEGRRISLLTFSGLVLGLAVLTKSWPALMVLPVAIFICSSQRSFCRAVGDASIMLLCCLIVALPWTFYAHRLDPQLAAYETRQMLAHLFTVVENQGGTWHYYLDRLRISYGELVYLPCIWYLIRARHVGRAPLRAAMAVWLLIPLVTYSVAATKMAGYLLPCTIPILAMTATCWVVMLRAEWWSKRLHRLAMVVMVALLALPVRYAVERLKPLQDLTPMLAKREALLQRISLSETDTWLINTDHPIEAMFYSDHLAVGDQDPESIDRASNKR
jgi:4-amino-4-deoxy-L-arabinose transferase